MNHIKFELNCYVHEIQQLRAENQSLRGEVKALRALLVSSRKRKFT